MNGDILEQLAELLSNDSHALLARWRHQVRQLPSAQQLDVPTLNDHIPELLLELSAALRSGAETSIPESLCQKSPPAHGLLRLQEAFDIEEVVAEYNILRGCIHDLADENHLNLQGKPFHIMNQVLDHAIGLAVQTFATQRALDIQRRREEHLAFVAHDLRTPLNAISLAGRVLELTLPEKEIDAEALKMLRALRRGVQQLEELVGTILRESTDLETEIGVKLERREFDLWPLVEALIHDLHPVSGTASTRLINQVPGDLMVFADASLLRRVFQNLIANAIAYTPRGRIVIGAAESQAEGLVECWVSDNGAGIPEDLIDRIFHKGESDPDNAEGTGLGLAIVKTFTEAHGGTVSVESREGAGSTFRFRIPLNRKL